MPDNSRVPDRGRHGGGRDSPEGARSPLDIPMGGTAAGRPANPTEQLVFDILSPRPNISSMVRLLADAISADRVDDYNMNDVLSGDDESDNESPNDVETSVPFADDLSDLETSREQERLSSDDTDPVSISELKFHVICSLESWPDVESDSSLPRDSPIRNLDPTDTIPAKQPADKYRDPLGLQFKGCTQLDSSGFEPFRSNLAVSSKMWNLLFTASRSFIYVFGYSAVTGLLRGKPLAMLFTGPSVTTERMRAGANWPSNPHGINLIKIATLADREVLIYASDNSRVVLYYVEDIADRVYTKGFHDCTLSGQAEAREELPPHLNNGIDEPDIVPVAVLQGQRSAWGVAVHNKKMLVAVSDNSRSVSVFDLSPILRTPRMPTSSFRKVVSPMLDNNLPDIEFVETSNPNDIFLSCVSISGQTVMWKVTLPGQSETSASDPEELSPLLGPPLDQQDSVREPHTWMLSSKHFSLVFEEQLHQEAWTISFLEESDFKVVDTFFEATGNKWTDLDATINYKKKENAVILGSATVANSPLLPEDPLNLFPIWRFTTHDVETKYVQPNTWASISDEPYHSLPLCRMIHKNGKIKRYLDRHMKSIDHLVNSPFKNRFLFVTSKQSMYLCQAEDLFCNAARSNVFSWGGHYGSDGVYFDRLSIVKVIKPLSTVIVASQIGAVAIFRLTRCRGMFCMRQEYCLPEPDKFLYEHGTLRVLAGLSVRPCDSLEAVPTRYRLELLFLDGLVLSYELFRKLDDSLTLSSTVL